MNTKKLEPRNSERSYICIQVWTHELEACKYKKTVLLESQIYAFQGFLQDWDQEEYIPELVRVTFTNLIRAVSTVREPISYLFWKNRWIERSVSNFNLIGIAWIRNNLLPGECFAIFSPQVQLSSSDLNIVIPQIIISF